MTNTMTNTPRKAQSVDARPKQATTSPRFEWAMITLCSWFLGGLYFDGWAHQHEPGLESFFTIWHAVFYSGFMSVGLLIMGAIIHNRRRGYTWRQAIPRGYELSVIGATIFLIGGVGDLIWHEALGIEEDVEALLSPTHLLFSGGMVLILLGPLRAAWHRPQTTQQTPFTAILSVLLALSAFTFFTMYANPYGRPWAASGNKPAIEVIPFSDSLPNLPWSPDEGIHSEDIIQSLGVGSILLGATIFMGSLFLLIRRWDWHLPMGSLTVIFTGNAFLMGIMRDLLILLPSALVAGITADLLLRWLKPSIENPRAMRVFAFAVPAILFTFYFLNIMYVQDIWWTAHLWLGAIVLAGIVGWLLSYLVVPPSLPSSALGKAGHDGA